MSTRLPLDRQRLAKVCRSYYVRRLALFGSALREDFRPDSDVDLLIEFDPDRRPGMVGLHQLGEELSGVFGGHRIDLVNPRYLNRRIRDSVLGEAEVQFAEV